MRVLWYVKCWSLLLERASIFRVVPPSGRRGIWHVFLDSFVIGGLASMGYVASTTCAVLVPSVSLVFDCHGFHLKLSNLLGALSAMFTGRRT